jgi:hypothetical protein
MIFLNKVEDPQGGKSTQKLKMSNRLHNLYIGADLLKNLEVEDQDFLVENLIPRGSLCGLVGDYQPVYNNEEVCKYVTKYIGKDVDYDFVFKS